MDKHHQRYQASTGHSVSLGMLRTLGRSAQRMERRGITVNMDAINRSKKRLLEPGDSSLFLRECDKQGKITLGSADDRIWMERDSS